MDVRRVLGLERQGTLSGLQSVHKPVAWFMLRGIEIAHFSPSGRP